MSVFAIAKKLDVETKDSSCCHFELEPEYHAFFGNALYLLFFHFVGLTGW